MTAFHPGIRVSDKSPSTSHAIEGGEGGESLTDGQQEHPAHDHGDYVGIDYSLVLGMGEVGGRIFFLGQRHRDFSHTLHAASATHCHVLVAMREGGWQSCQSRQARQQGQGRSQRRRLHGRRVRAREAGV